MDVAILAAVVILIGLVATVLLRRTEAGPVREMREAKDVISDHALKTINEIKGIGETVYKLAQQQEEAQKLGDSLKDLLQAPRLRGSYGEAVLEEMLDRVLPKGIWDRQYVIEGRETVDCVVKYRDVVVPIDAKFPRDDYRRYMEAETEGDKSSYWRDFESSVKEKIRSIEAKYVKPEKGTTEFALMFIPSEAIYYETIAEKNHLGEPSSILEYAQEHHVVPVSPNTFYAFLQVILLGIRNIEIIKGAKRLQDGLSNLQRSFELFHKKHEEIGAGIEKAAEAYRVGSGHIDRFKRRLDSTLQLEGFPEESEALTSESSPDR